MDNLTPITREEMLLNDEPLTPITREEKILAGEDLTPVTRREYFLKKYRHAGGDVMVDGLSVTENGTYTAPEGKAYSPVEVSVPLPDNAYLLKAASGSLVSFSDGTDLPMPSFICNIDAVQDLHGYDAPWVGGAGKNKLKYPYYASSTTLNGVTFTVNDDGTINVNGTASADASFYLAYTGSDMVLPQGEYTLNGCPSGGSNATYMLNITNISTQDIGSGANFTSDGTTSLNIRIIVRANTTASNLLFKPMIRLASVSDGTYAPYSNICPISGHTGVDATVSPTTEASAGTTYSISWQTEAGEVYGGYVDLVSGVLTVTYKEITLDGATEGKLFTYKGNSNNYYFYEDDGYSFGYESSSWISTNELIQYGMINSHYYYNNGNPTIETGVGFGARLYVNNQGAKRLQIRLFFGADSSITTLELANQWLATQYANGTPWQVKYPLATPITYQLTPQQIKSLLGKNNAWASTGDVNVDYFAKEVTG